MVQVGSNDPESQGGSGAAAADLLSAERAAAADLFSAEVNVYAHETISSHHQPILVSRSRMNQITSALVFVASGENPVLLSLLQQCGVLCFICVAFQGGCLCVDYAAICLTLLSRGIARNWDHWTLQTSTRSLVVGSKPLPAVVPSFVCWRTVNYNSRCS